MQNPSPEPVNTFHPAGRFAYLWRGANHVHYSLLTGRKKVSKKCHFLKVACRFFWSTFASKQSAIFQKSNVFLVQFAWINVYRCYILKNFNLDELKQDFESLLHAPVHERYIEIQCLHFSSLLATSFSILAIVSSLLATSFSVSFSLLSTSSIAVEKPSLMT